MFKRIVRKLVPFWIILLIHSNTQIAQVLYETTNHSVYDFLERMEIQSIIILDSEIKPYNKKYIAEKLKEITACKEKLNSVEREELKWYLKKYDYFLGGEKKDIFGEYFLSEADFKMQILPLAGYGASAYGKNLGHSTLVGIKFEGTYGSRFGASFQYLDRGEYGENVDLMKNLSPETGYNFHIAPDGIEFTDLIGSINYNWNWGSISLKKDYNMWGSAKFGQLILSTKAASYPHLELELEPTNWIKFHYIFGSISSLIPDSTTIYYSYASKLEPFKHIGFINKYIVANIFNIKPAKWLSFSLGNSYIYSGALRLETFIPFMYYKALDHDLGRENYDDGNGELFFDLRINYPHNFSFYSTLLIDALEIRELLRNNWYKSWFGYTIGGRATNLILDNLDITIEYTHIDPWVYENRFSSVTYKHLNYSLGHWAGQNSDFKKLKINYKFISRLDISIALENFRKGGLIDINYGTREKIDLPHLAGNKRNDTRYTFDIKFEPIHNLYMNFHYSYSRITDEETGRTPDFMLGRNHIFSIAVQYGNY